MSTILKALRRLEREKSAQEDRPLKDEVTAAPAGGSRRGFPLLALLIATGALGLGLGSSLLWLWPREGAAPAAPQTAEAPRPLEALEFAQPPNATRRAGAAPVAPAEPAPIAAQAATPPVAPVASAPPPPAVVAAPPAPPVAVISRPASTRAAPPPVAAEPTPEAVVAKPAPPERGSLPPFAHYQAEAAPEPLPAAAAPKPPPKQVARANVPDVLVSSTVWHPQRDRRLAMVAFEGKAARELHEGDAIGPLVVSEISPSAVVFLYDGVELRRRVGAKN